MGLSGSDFPDRALHASEHLTGNLFHGVDFLRVLRGRIDQLLSLVCDALLGAVHTHVSASQSLRYVVAPVFAPQIDATLARPRGTLERLLAPRESTEPSQTLFEPVVGDREREPHVAFADLAVTRAGRDHDAGLLDQAAREVGR